MKKRGCRPRFTSLLLVIAVVVVFMLSQASNRQSAQQAQVTPSLALSPTPNGFIRQADYGEAWAFTVDEGVIGCEPGGRVIFRQGGNTYAVNGTAMTWAERYGYSDIDPIWRTDPTGRTPKVDIGPFITLGLSLCEGD